MLKKMKDLKALVMFRRPSSMEISATINSFSDAAFNILRTKQYG